MVEHSETGIRGVKARDRTDSPGAKLGMWLAILGLVILSIWAYTAVAEAPDPHYVAATRKLASYEDTKHPDGRDYSLPVYQKVLAELAQVDPESISAPAASALMANIETHMAAAEREDEERRAFRRGRIETRRALREADDMARDWQASVTSHVESEGGYGDDEDEEDEE